MTVFFPWKGNSLPDLVSRSDKFVWQNQPPLFSITHTWVKAYNADWKPTPPPFHPDPPYPHQTIWQRIPSPPLSPPYIPEQKNRFWAKKKGLFGQRNRRKWESEGVGVVVYLYCLHTGSKVWYQRLIGNQARDDLVPTVGSRGWLNDGWSVPDCRIQKLTRRGMIWSWAPDKNKEYYMEYYTDREI